jgi:hypothetical protein
VTKRKLKKNSVFYIQLEIKDLDKDLLETQLRQMMSGSRQGSLCGVMGKYLDQPELT